VRVVLEARRHLVHLRGELLDLVPGRDGGAVRKVAPADALDVAPEVEDRARQPAREPGAQEQGPHEADREQEQRARGFRADGRHDLRERALDHDEPAGFRHAPDGREHRLAGPVARFHREAAGRLLGPAARGANVRKIPENQAAHRERRIRVREHAVVVAEHVEDRRIAAARLPQGVGHRPEIHGHRQRFAGAPRVRHLHDDRRKLARPDARGLEADGARGCRGSGSDRLALHADAPRLHLGHEELLAARVAHRDLEDRREEAHRELELLGKVLQPVAGPFDAVEARDEAGLALEVGFDGGGERDRLDRLPALDLLELRAVSEECLDRHRGHQRDAERERELPPILDEQPREAMPVNPHA
jgi:hypothetical protein